MQLNKRQLAKRNLIFKNWADRIRVEIKQDEDGDVRAIIAVIPSFTGLMYPSEIKEFMEWCRDNNYQDLYNEWLKWK